jgi:hypothetical protein
MAAGQQVFFVHIRDSACCGYVHVTAYQNGAHGGTGNQWLRLLLFAGRAHTHHRYDAGCGELGGKLSYGRLIESVKHERSVNRLEVLRIALHRIGVSHAGTAGFRRSRPGRGRRARLRDALVKLIDLQHLFNGRHPGNRLFGELSDAVGNRAQQLAVDVDRAAAHARDHSGELGFFTQQLHQHHIALGAVQVPENAQHHHAHGFRLGALENGITHALHPRTHVFHLHDWGRSGFLLGGWAGGKGLGMAQAQKDEENVQQTNGFFHTANLKSCKYNRTYRLTALEKWLLKS